MKDRIVIVTGGAGVLGQAVVAEFGDFGGGFEQAQTFPAPEKN